MAKYDFDRIINRRNTKSYKWDTMDERYGCYDMIHLGAADMDFQAPQQIRQGLQQILDMGLLNYTRLGNGFYSAIQRWYGKQYGEDVPREWIVPCTGISSACGICVGELTRPEEEVMIHAPYYGPLKDAVEGHQRKLLVSPLICRDGRYEMDFVQMEKMVTDKTRMLILCSPHDPTGRVWTRGEISKLEEFCFRHHLLLLADEIYADITAPGIQHETALTVSEPMKQRLILASSPVKTFNITGLMISYLIIPNEKIREEIQRDIIRRGLHNSSVFAGEAVERAYNLCDDWHREVNQYVNENEDFMREYFEQNFPELTILPREGTYMMWVDYRALEKTEEEMEDWMTKSARVSAYMGSRFGAEGVGYFRLNLATSQLLLKLALERMRRAYHLLFQEEAGEEEPMEQEELHREETDEAVGAGQGEIGLEAPK